MTTVEERRRTETPSEALVRSVFEEHRGAIYAQAVYLTADHGAAEDIVQETFLRAWRHAGRLVEMRSIRGWLLTVARNLAIDRSRTRNAHPIVAASAAVPVQADHADHVLASLTVLGAMAHLPVTHREVLEQLYLHGSTTKEAAEALSIPLGTVKSRSYHALQTLRALLTEPQVGP